MASPLDFFFLTDGGQPPEDVAKRVAAFLDGASKTLDIAIYDLRLDAEPSSIVFAAFENAKNRGVAIRLVFNQDHAVAIPVPPPPEIDWAFIDRLKAIGVQVKPVPGIPDLMHHKYVVRDVGSAEAAVLTGSTNWTNDSWTREENVMFTVVSGDVATAYSANFRELWDRPVVATSGRVSSVWSTLSDATGVRAFFCPGRGLRLAHAMAHSLSAAQKRIRICSPVITSGPILGTLADVCQHSHIDIGGVYDATQMDEVEHQWADQPGAAWKITAFHCIATSIPFGTKHSTPYSKTSVHDFMHAKLLVADDTVYAGSFNLSHSGEQNAENVLEIQSAAVAEMCTQFIDRVAARYGGPPLKEAPQP